MAIATSLLVFLVWKRFHPEGDHRNWEALLLVADSIGLGIFSVHGAAACMLLWSAGENLALLTGCALTVVLRLCAAVFRWSLPKA